jgi:glycosyltransferase involved in cell wall biosynthesis
MPKRLHIMLELERMRNLNSGLGQFCRHLGLALTQNEEKQWEVLAPEACLHLFNKQVATQPVRWWQKWWTIQTDATIWHLTHQDSKYWPSSKGVHVVLTIHDLNFLEGGRYSKWRKVLKLNKVQRAIDRASAVVYISQYTRNQVHKHLKVSGNKIEKVIYNGNCLNEKIEMQPPNSMSQSGKAYVFSIGVHPKKQYDRLLPLLAKLPELQWVIAGGSGQEVYLAQLRQEAKKHGVSDQLHLIGTVTEAERRWLYLHCAALWFPSGAEGFGLPVIEALSVGKPVFAWSGTSLREVGGHWANYWESWEPTALLSVWQSGMLERGGDEKFAEGAKKWASQFTWDSAAKQYLALYDQVAEMPKTR